MFTAKCPKCPWEKNNYETQGKANLAVAMHSARMHTRGKGLSLKKNGGTIRRGKQPQVNTGGRPRKEEGAPKSPYKRRKPVESNITINFCPGCGCDIRKVAMGMALAERIK